MKKYMREINGLQKYGKKVCAGVARWGADWAGSAFARARVLARGGASVGRARAWSGRTRGGRWPFRGEPRWRLETILAGGLTPSPGQGLQGFVDFTALGFYELLLFSLSNSDNASSIKLSD